MPSIETLMSDWRYDRRNRHDVVTIPLIWVAFVLSLLVHIAALWIMLPKLLHDLSEVDANAGKSGGALAVQLEPKPSTPSPPSAASPPPVLARAAPPRTPAKPLQKPRPTAPPVLAMPKPDAEVTLPKPTVPQEQPAPTVAPKPIEGDLAAYVEARRRARGESAPAPSTAGKDESSESDLERRNRIVAANLGLNATPTFGYDPKSAGGIFQIEHMSYEYADFYFFGLNRDVGRNTKQLIEVKRGAESDIRVALIRKMITIIRDNVSGDFVWLSRRGPVTMSARLNDNAELEAFIMRDVFPDERLPR